MPHAQQTYNPPSEPYLDIVYEDSDILVVDKPAGLLSVAGKGDELKDCVEYRARMQFGWITACHRLDMATSGLMVLARNKPALAHVSQQFEQRQTKKTYVAVVFGQMEHDDGEVNLPLICDWPNRPKQMVCHKRGKPAITHYRVLERLDNATKVEFTPITGRSHQLRVHAMALGHPILGDNFYAEAEAFNMADRLLLHAQNLHFTQPKSGKLLEFTSQPDF